MAKVRKRTWRNKAGEQTAWIADYFSSGPDGKPRRHIETFKTKKDADGNFNGFERDAAGNLVVGTDTLTVTGGFRLMMRGQLTVADIINIQALVPHMGRIEDTHMIVCHMIGYYFMEEKERFGA